MTSRGTHSLAYVGVAFVTLSAAMALSVMWLVGGMFHGIMMDFGRGIPLPTYWAIRSRRELTIVVLSALLLAFGVHRHPRAVVSLVLLGCLEVTIAAAYGFALWLTMRGMSPGFES